MCYLTYICISKSQSEVLVQNSFIIWSQEKQISPGQMNTPGGKPDRFRGIQSCMMMPIPCTHRSLKLLQEIWGEAKSLSATLNVDTAPNIASKQLISGFQSCQRTGGREIPTKSWVLTVRCIHVQNMQRIIC